MSEAPWLRGRVSSTQTWTFDALVMRLIDRRQRRAPIDAGEPAGIAMGEDVDALARLLRGGCADEPERRARRCAGRSRRPRRRSARRGHRQRRRARRAAGCAQPSRISSSAQRRLMAVGRVAREHARRRGRAPRRTASSRSARPRRRRRSRRSAARRARCMVGWRRRVLASVSATVSKRCGSLVWSMISTDQPSASSQMVR